MTILASTRPPVAPADKHARRAQRLREVVEKAKRRLDTAPLQERHPGARWGDLAWEVVGGGKQGRKALCFTLTVAPKQVLRTHAALEASGAAPYPAWLADPIRAFLTEKTRIRPHVLVIFLSTVRAFWRFLVASGRAGAEPGGPAWSWTRLDDATLAAFEAFHAAEVARCGTRKPGTVCAGVDRMVSFGTWLYRRGVTGQITYVPRSDPSSERWEDPAAQMAAGAHLLPPPGAVEELAQLYHEVMRGCLQGVLSPVDEAVVLLLVLALLTGRRLGELLTLREDCLVWQRVQPWEVGWGVGRGELLAARPEALPPDERLVLGIRHWQEKKQYDDESVCDVMPSAAPVVEECVVRLRALTDGPRARARELERSPDTVPLPPPYDTRDELSRDEIGELWPVIHFRLASRGGRVYSGISPVLRRYGLRAARRAQEAGSPGRYRRVDFQATLQRLRRVVLKDDVVLRLDGGAVQRPSESLLVFFHRDGHARSRPCRLLVRMLTTGNVATRLHRGAGATLWQRVRQTAPTLGTARLRSHAFRRWLNSVAFAGGAPLGLLTDYFGRQSDEQTKAYLYPAAMVGVSSEATRPTELARSELLRESIRAGRSFGPVALGYFRVMVRQGKAAAEAYLARNVSQAHPTIYGHCTRDLSLVPCDKHLGCVDDCGDYVGTKGDPLEVAALEEFEERLRQEQIYLTQVRAIGYEVHPDRLARSHRQLAQVQRLLGYHRDPTTPDGTTLTNAGPAPRRLVVLPPEPPPQPPAQSPSSPAGPPP